ncbi:armadillo-type protein [Dipodascopsis tothii]|uniref:armadillo-type protein n=1 Tax=Dipodascopsis tothii TaxID=44089 RepID=UPI0034CE8FEA
MASTGGDDAALAPFFEALRALYSGSDSRTKEQANQYLEQFQKSEQAWSVTYTVLSSGTASAEAKVFAAQTLRSKIVYDMHQLAPGPRLQLRDSILGLLATYKAGPKVIVTQLCVALASLALQLLDWENPVQDVLTAVGSSPDSASLVLEFLKVLPEEMSDLKKISLSDEELRTRTGAVLEQNAMQILNLLVMYAQSPQVPAASQPYIFECLNSWIREIPISAIVASPLLDLTFVALTNPELFDAATDAICSLIRETRDVYESAESVPPLYAKVIALRPLIMQSKDDSDAFRNLTRIFAEAGEAWHMLIARSPAEYRPLVEAIAECTAFDDDLEVVQYTFYFWYILKQMIVLERYQDARLELQDVFRKLVDIMIQHLHYPYGDDDSNLFENDKEQEDKFRSFRHEMGDVLKDCCGVVGAANALQMAYDKVNVCLQAQAAGEKVAWQDVEAPLFSMRTMAREVDLAETSVLPNIMNMLVHLPEHPKIRYAATLVLGRYTEWTAKHPEYLTFQLNYITGGFYLKDLDVLSAAAQALMHFCRDCSQHLMDSVGQLHEFYEKVAPEIDLDSLYDITDGVAHIVAGQPVDKVYEALRLFCEPIARRILAAASVPADEKACRRIADEIELLDTFARLVRPDGDADPSFQFWTEVWPMLSTVLDNKADSVFISERSCKLMRTLMSSHKQHFVPLLQPVAEKLVLCFDKTHHGCYLWASGIFVREFGTEFMDASVQDAVWQFGHRQCMSGFRMISAHKFSDIPDIIEDLFRLLENMLTNFPYIFLSSDICKPALDAGLTALNLEKTEPLFAVLDFFHDLFSFGFETPPVSRFSADGGADKATNTVPIEVQQAVKALIMTNGLPITTGIFSGLIYSFPRECLADASGVMLVILRLTGADAVQWISATIDLLPAGSITQDEKVKFLTSISAHLQASDHNRVRSQLQDFVNWYTRRNITPRTTLRGIANHENLKFNFA